MSKRNINLLTVYLNKLKEKGAFHVVLGSFMTKFVAFFGSIFIVRLLSKSDYGILSYYENFSSYFGVFAGMGLSAGLLRYMVIAEDFPQKKACFLHGIRRGTIWNFILLTFGLLLVRFYPHPDAFSGHYKVAAMLLLCIPFVFFLDAGLATLRGLFSNRAYAVISFASSFTLIVARVLGALVGGLFLTTVTRFIAEVLCASLCIGYIYQSFFKSLNRASLGNSFIREMDIYSLQMMLTNGLWAVFMLNDVFLIGQFSGNENVLADYKVAFVIPANLSILVSAIGVFVAPYFTKNENEKNYVWIRNKFKLVLCVTMLIMGFASMACFLLAKPMIRLLYGEAYLTAVPTMKLLLIASFFNNGIRSTVANILSATGIQKLNLYVAGAGMLVQIVLDVLLIPRFGGVGVAISSSCVYLFMSIALLVVFRQKFYRKGTT